MRQAGLRIGGSLRRRLDPSVNDQTREGSEHARRALALALEGRMSCDGGKSSRAQHDVRAERWWTATRVLSELDESWDSERVDGCCDSQGTGKDKEVVVGSRSERQLQLGKEHKTAQHSTAQHWW